MAGASRETKRERVWDPLVRLFHWSLVGAFVTAWFGRGEAIIHETAGKIVLGLIVFRVVWGIIGPASARFEMFIRGPKETLSYLLSIFRGKPEPFAGHNPAGAAMIVLMFAVLALTAVSGILMSTTALWGNSGIEWFHGISAYLMLLLIAGHLSGVIIASLQHRENLAVAMLTGWKSVPVDIPPYLGKVRFGIKRLAYALLFAGLTVGGLLSGTKILEAGYWRMEKILHASGKKIGCEVKAVHGPYIEIFPRVAIRYQVAFAGRDVVVDTWVPASVALQKRPDLDLSKVREGCESVLAASKMGDFVQNLALAITAVRQSLRQAVVGISNVTTSALVSRRTEIIQAGKPEALPIKKVRASTLSPRKKRTIKLKHKRLRKQYPYDDRHDHIDRDDDGHKNGGSNRGSGGGNRGSGNSGHGSGN